MPAKMEMFSFPPNVINKPKATFWENTLWRPKWQFFFAYMTLQNLNKRDFNYQTPGFVSLTSRTTFPFAANTALFPTFPTCKKWSFKATNASLTNRQATGKTQKMASCFTLPTRFTRLKNRNSNITSEDHNSEVSLQGFMPP